MTTGDRLLQEILANPLDDGPRLVYADWLDEDGQAARAELIRVQCELAKLPIDSPWWTERSLCPECDCTARHTATCRFGVLVGREQELLDAHQHIWLSQFALAVIPPEDGPPPAGSFWQNDDEVVGAIMKYHKQMRLAVCCKLQRGFVDSVVCRAAEWLAHGPAVVARDPVRTVSLTDKQPYDYSRGYGEWTWWRGEECSNYEATMLPDCLWLLLPEAIDDLLTEARDYRTKDAAHAALSAAALTWAKAETERHRTSAIS